MNVYKVTLTLTFNQLIDKASPLTDDFFQTTTIADYTKQVMSPADFLKGLFEWDEIMLIPTSEKWEDSKFAITFLVLSALEEEGMIEDYFTEVPLENTVYTTDVENGWVILSRDNGETYGVIDYRYNNTHVEKLITHHL